ncbi:hypothetical protein GGI20_002390 [Coemansia sp. BCRC 34301]|nr:hypothetical protein GGI20_002390 [Coemansia sp. BCRC 34301]
MEGDGSFKLMWLKHTVTMPATGVDYTGEDSTGEGSTGDEHGPITFAEEDGPLLSSLYPNVTGL